jgi:hypothetical protein
MKALSTILFALMASVCSASSTQLAEIYYKLEGFTTSYPVTFEMTVGAQPAETPPPPKWRIEGLTPAANGTTLMANASSLGYAQLDFPGMADVFANSTSTGDTIQMNNLLSSSSLMLLVDLYRMVGGEYSVADPGAYGLYARVLVPTPSGATSIVGYSVDHLELNVVQAGFEYRLGVFGTAVPEPCGFLMLACGGPWWLRRCRS